jgi:hypothetical protein
MPEQFRCDTCGKTFPSEADALQHTQMLHNESGVGGYSRADDKKGKEDADRPLTPGLGR